MSTSPSDSHRTGPVAVAIRAALVVASILVVASSTSAFADLGDRPPAPVPPTVSPLPDVVIGDAVAPSDGDTLLLDGCVGAPDRCGAVPVLEPSSEPDPDVRAVPSCRLPGLHDPQGTIQVVLNPAAPSTGTIRFRVEVEEGLSVNRDCFAATVTSILIDERGWTGDGGPSFARVGDDSYDFRLILASPDTTDRLCYPAATGGKYSCRNQDKVVVNLMRWEEGTDEFSEELDTYRRYLINHEVGHLLGHGHESCTQAGTPAPVMMQQTKGLGDCLPNGWPREDER